MTHDTHPARPLGQARTPNPRPLSSPVAQPKQRWATAVPHQPQCPLIRYPCVAPYVNASQHSLQGTHTHTCKACRTQCCEKHATLALLVPLSTIHHYLWNHTIIKQPLDVPHHFCAGYTTLWQQQAQPQGCAAINYANKSKLHA